MEHSDTGTSAGPARAEVHRIGIDTHDEPIVYLREDSPVVRSEGFEALARVRLEGDRRTVIAALNVVSAELLDVDEAGLSEAAWRRLSVQEGDIVEISHPRPLQSLSYVRGKVYGERLDDERAHAIVGDVVDGRYSNAHLAAFITACAGDRLDLEETVHLARAMVDTGQRLEWDVEPVVDKHSVGGLPGNRTTPIVVAIVAAAGLTIPKTSSRAITSPAGTADTMATITDVDLSIARLREVVSRENGCLAWGGHVRLSPADDILIRVERSLDLDSEGQLVASVLSKKAAAGSELVVIDMPVGPTAKVRDDDRAATLSERLVAVGDRLGLNVRVVRGPGLEPIGRGIGPALEAHDVLDVLEQASDRPVPLEERSLELAGAVLEMGGATEEGAGIEEARAILRDGRAWEKFRAICEAQGGFRRPGLADHRETVRAETSGRVEAIDNRSLARVAKLAGAPADPPAGLRLGPHLGDHVDVGDPLYTVFADNEGELSYALDFVESSDPIVTIAEDD